MFCSTCGKENADDAVYCQKCGRQFETEEETRVATRGGSSLAVDASTPRDPNRIFSITPTLKFIYVGYLLAVIGAFILVGLVSIFFPTTF